ncbi:Hsp20/alpha crystallin family protein [Halorussus salinisoli]|uniref:Hsp20/alpha crystallin family protein n=1 Tax=Halorussus salinisoli TaxID=2558242 RepID=UPI0010C1C82A|nr:Hsp20/alpha crystallin family protein [Halorussus salinisoli]
MPLPQRPASSWTQGLDFPSRLFETGSNDYELYEEDGEFVLNGEMPGFDPEDISVTWDDGVMNIAAERDDETRGRRQTYHRRFRFPKDIDDAAITAEYTNGVVEVRLPALEATTRGKTTPVEG